MSQESNHSPIIYQAALKADLVHRLPQSIRSDCVELTCGSCQASLLGHGKLFTKTITSAKFAKRPVLVLCPTCLAQGTKDKDDLIYVYFHDPHMESLLARHEAEMN